MPPFYKQTADGVCLCFYCGTAALALNCVSFGWDFGDPLNVICVAAVVGFDRRCWPALVCLFGVYVFF